MREQVEAALDTYVRPYLRADGGEIEVLEIEDGVVRFRLTGKCAGCAAADYTAEELVSTELKSHVEGVREAVLVNMTSQSLIDEARAILRMRGSR